MSRDTRRTPLWIWFGTFPWLPIYSDIFDENFRRGDMHLLSPVDQSTQLDAIGTISWVRSIVFPAIILAICGISQEGFGFGVSFMIQFPLALWLPVFTMVVGVVQLFVRARSKRGLGATQLHMRMLAWSPAVALCVALPLGLMFGSAV